MPTHQLNQECWDGALIIIDFQKAFLFLTHQKLENKTKNIEFQGMVLPGRIPQLFKVTPCRGCSL